MPSRTPWPTGAPRNTHCLPRSRATPTTDPTRSSTRSGPFCWPDLLGSCLLPHTWQRSVKGALPWISRQIGKRAFRTRPWPRRLGAGDGTVLDQAVSDAAASPALTERQQGGPGPAIRAPASSPRTRPPPRARTRAVPRAWGSGGTGRHLAPHPRPSRWSKVCPPASTRSTAPWSRSRPGRECGTCPWSRPRRCWTVSDRYSPRCAGSSSATTTSCLEVPPVVVRHSSKGAASRRSSTVGTGKSGR